MDNPKPRKFWRKVASKTITLTASTFAVLSFMSFAFWIGYNVGAGLFQSPAITLIQAFGVVIVVFTTFFVVLVIAEWTKLVMHRLGVDKD